MKKQLLSDDKTNLQIFPSSEREVLVCMYEFPYNTAGNPRLSYPEADIAVDTTRNDKSNYNRTTSPGEPEFKIYLT